MWRSSLERFSRGRVIRRSLQTRNGRRDVFLTPEASLKYWLPGSANSDRPLLEAVDRFVPEGARVWDIGANVGLFSFYAAAAAGSTGRVLAVDADPFLTSLLLRSAQGQRNGDAPVTVVTTAVSDHVGTAELVIPIRSRASSHLSDSPGCTQTGGRRESFATVCVSLDFLLAETFAPSFVKMDIEGLEARALQVSPRLLTEVRPVFHLEVWDEIADELSRIFWDAGYQLFDFEADRELAAPVARATWCTIARPIGARSG